MNVIFENSAGVSIDLNAGRPVRLKEANFHQYEWEYDGTNQQYGVDIARFEKKPAEYECSIYFRGSKMRRSEQLTDFHEAATYDIVNQTPGRLIWGDYYIRCYVVESSTYPHEEDASVTVNDVIFLCPYPFWVREQVESFSADQSEADTSGLDYPFDYSFDYAKAVISRQLTIDHFIPSDFHMTIYGPCSSPAVTIGGYTYQVFVDLIAGEYLVIDSREHTVKVYKAGGVVENAYNARLKEHSIFERIPPGTHSIALNSDFALEMIIYLERNEPIWN